MPSRFEARVRKIETARRAASQKVCVREIHLDDIETAAPDPDAMLTVHLVRFNDSQRLEAEHPEIRNTPVQFP
jgi:hypothetical protein